MSNETTSELSYADTLWKSADALRAKFAAAEGKLGGDFQRLRDKTATPVFFTPA